MDREYVLIVNEGIPAILYDDFFLCWTMIKKPSPRYPQMINGKSHRCINNSSEEHIAVSSVLTYVSISSTVILLMAYFFSLKALVRVLLP